MYTIESIWSIIIRWASLDEVLFSSDMLHLCHIVTMITISYFLVTYYLLLSSLQYDTNVTHLHIDPSDPHNSCRYLILSTTSWYVKYNIKFNIAKTIMV